ncbi:MAG: hypothetical protein KC620_15500, partial [Myxococcales bacterium]|nr:hypothetical protein [Myxococcales bacterium]
MRALILLVFFVGCGAAPAPRVSTEGDDARLLDRLAAAPPPADWAMVGKTPLDFATYHPQGLLRVGDRWLLTTVEIRRPPAADDPGEGVGHLIAFDDAGHELARVTLGEGKAFHPGGFDLDGEALLVPVAEYRPDSATIVYRVDPQTLAATVAFRVADHIGAIAVDRLDGTVYGMSWGSRRIY